MRMIQIIVALAVIFLAMGTTPAHAGQARKLGEGDGVFRPVALGALPAVLLRDELTPGQRAYLGLGASGPFTVGGVRGDLVVVEFFNSSCYACALLAPVMDQAWHKVDARADLKDRVRFVVIGVGNTTEQVRDFRDSYGTPFPMIADPEFAAFDALGTVEGTPYLMLLRRGSDGTLTARAQVGYIPQADFVAAAIEAVLADTPPVDAKSRELAGSGWRTLRSPLTEAELDARLVAAAADAGLVGVVVNLAPISITKYKNVGSMRMTWPF